MRKRRGGDWSQDARQVLSVLPGGLGLSTTKEPPESELPNTLVEKSEVENEKGEEETSEKVYELPSKSFEN